MRRLTPAIAVVALLVAGCGDDPAPEVDVAPPEETTPDDEPEPDEPEPDDDADSDDADSDDAATEDDAAGDDTDDSADDTDADGPSPDPAAMDDPCAEHLDREGAAFLELVSPVDDQRVGDELELVGCASVPEATVQYRLLDGDGLVLDEGFTTAECGGPCIGAFRETVSLSAADGEPTVQVQLYWEDFADGSERDLVERTVVLE